MINLKNATAGMDSKVDMAVVDCFRRNSALLDMMPFDNVITPGTGRSTLTYGYVQLKKLPTAGLREIGGEYEPSVAEREAKTANAIIMGGQFEVDRLLQDTVGAVDEVAFQAEEMIKATANLFHYNAINAIADGTGFSGLRELLQGTDSEVNSNVSIATTEELDANYNAFLDEMDEFLAKVEGKPDALLMNTKMLIKLRAMARRAGYYERTVDEFGKPVETYAGIPMLDVGKYHNGLIARDVIPITEGYTEIFAVCFGPDAFHGISTTGNSVIRAYLPGPEDHAIKKTGSVELVAGVVLKNTKKAAVLKNIHLGM